MSDDNELIKALREWPLKITRRAADAIERLTVERDTAQAALLSAELQAMDPGYHEAHLNAVRAERDAAVARTHELAEELAAMDRRRRDEAIRADEAVARTQKAEAALTICGVVNTNNERGEPLACGYPVGHDSAHAWAPFTEYVVSEKP